MNPKRKKRLALVLSIVFGGAIAVSLVLYSMDQNINLFYSPAQIANGEVPADQRIRAGGMVVEGSVYRDKESLKVSFGLTDYEGTIEVEYDGILPDLFREGQGIVALGRMNDKNVFVASEVLAKHDEQYMPPEVQQALDKAKGNKSEANTSAAAGYGS